MEANNKIQAIYTARPSLVAKRLGYKGALSGHDNLTVILKETENSRIVYDSYSGQVKIELDQDFIDIGLEESRQVLVEHGLPLLFEDQSLLEMKSWDLGSVFESETMNGAGFLLEGRTWRWKGISN